MRTYVNRFIILIIVVTFFIPDGECRSYTKDEKKAIAGSVIKIFSQVGAKIAKRREDKKFKKTVEAFYEEAERYTDPSSPFYDPYYIDRFIIDYESHTIKEKAFSEFIAGQREKEQQAETMKIRNQLIEYGLVGEWEYDAFFGNDSLMNLNADLYREKRFKLSQLRLNEHYGVNRSQPSNTSYSENNENVQIVVEEDLNTIASDNIALNNKTDMMTSENITEGKDEEEDTTGNVLDDNSSSPMSLSDSIKEDLKILIDKIESINIGEYSFNSYDLSQSQKIELDSLSYLLLKNEDLKIIINGHTCDIGSEKANFNVGLKRAESAKKYLLEKGILADRIKCESKM